MPKYINADKLKVEETAAFEYAQSKLPNKIDRDLNEAVHIKLQRLLDDAPAEKVTPSVTRDRTDYPKKIKNPRKEPLYGTITVIRYRGNRGETIRFIADWLTLEDIRTNNGENIILIAEASLSGAVYRYDDSDKQWTQIGEVCGYA